MKKNKNAFTLVELLAVIVILAVILIIAVPRISDVINNSKKSSFEATAKTIASQAEKKYTENQILGKTDNINCSDVVKLNDKDYGACTITFDASGNATVSINGSGKFAGLTIKNATKNSATATELTATDTKYFSYEVKSDAKEIDYYDVTVTNQNKCVAYLKNMGETEDAATTICTGGIIESVVFQGAIPASDYELAGLVVNVSKKYISVNVGKCASYLPTIFRPDDYCTDEEKINVLPYIVDKNSHDKAGITLLDKANDIVSITEYNVAGGLDVVIPSEIDGYKVYSIGNNAFSNKEIKSVIIPDTVKTIGDSAFSNNRLTSITIPNSVTFIAQGAFYSNQLTSITFPTTPMTIEGSAFYNNPITDDETYEYPENVTVVTLVS